LENGVNAKMAEKENGNKQKQPMLSSCVVKVFGQNRLYRSSSHLLGNTTQDCTAQRRNPLFKNHANANKMDHASL
jgi:hypothetical protein